MQTSAPRQETKSIGGNEVVDVIFDALGGDNTFPGEPETNAASDALIVESLPMPWVLHVDDDQDLSAAMGIRLEAYGIKVVRAFDGAGGVRTAFSHPASAIILDYEMPNGQGDYVLGRLKDNPVTRDIPVIVLTGRKDRSLERKMLRLGAARFFNKPAEFNELLSELRLHVEIPEPE